MKRLAAVLVAAFAAAAMLLFMRGPQMATDLPSLGASASNVAETRTDADAMAPRAQDKDRAARFDVTAKTFRGLPTPGCEARARQRLERSRALDLGTVGRDAVALLQASGDTEHLLAAALMSTDRKELQDLLDRVLTADPDNRVAHWKNLENCHARGTDCDRRAVEKAVLAVDSANGLVWIDIASARMREERWDEAENALRRAAAAPRFDTYFMEYALLIERGLSAPSELGYADRVLAGLGFAAATAIPGYGEMTRRCGGEAGGRRLPADICFELGQQMAASGTELLAMLIGKSVQEKAATRLGDESLARKLEHENLEMRDALIGDTADSGAEVLMRNDVAVLQRYVDAFLAHGEKRATELLVTEARRLRQDPDYDQCNFVDNPELAIEPEAP